MENRSILKSEGLYYFDKANLSHTWSKNPKTYFFDEAQLSKHVSICLRLNEDPDLSSVG